MISWETKSPYFVILANNDIVSVKEIRDILLYHVIAWIQRVLINRKNIMGNRRFIHDWKLIKLSYLFLYISEVICPLVVAARGDAAAVTASFLQGLYGLCIDYTQEVVLFQRNSLFLLQVRVVCSTIQLNDVRQFAVAVVQLQLRRNGRKKLHQYAKIYIRELKRTLISKCTSCSGCKSFYLRRFKDHEDEWTLVFQLLQWWLRRPTR